jgi:Zn-dependent protease
MGLLNTSFKIGRLFGITIRIHVLFLIWIGYELFRAGPNWQIVAAQTAMVFAIVLVHEFGHCFGARAVGGDARNILLWPLGGLAYAEAPMTPWAQFVTIAAGPIVHPVFCAASAAILIATTGQIGVVPLSPFSHAGVQYLEAEWQLYVWIFYKTNLALLCFNLLPIFPFDGGQLFRALLWPFLGLHRATIIATQVGLVGAVGLGGLGAMRNDWFLLAIALFFGSTCWQHLQAARAGLVTEEFLSADHILREKRNVPGFWARLFRARGDRRAARPLEFPNPNPGGWQAREQERERTEAELDRLLKKVSEFGVQSLSYVERQTLERITRERQRAEREFQRDTRV